MSYDPEFEEILSYRFDSDAGDELSVMEYLRELLLVLWQEKEGFSGKRPFGNSGWEYDLYKVLVANGKVHGDLDEDGEIENVDKVHADCMIRDLILYIFEY